jgi:hypothetical protein
MGRHAQVVFYDFDGRTDGRSLRTILTHVAPRQLVMLHGRPHDTDELAQHLTKELGPLHTVVHTPQQGEQLDCTPQHRHYQVHGRSVSRQIHTGVDVVRLWVQECPEHSGSLPAHLCTADCHQSPHRLCWRLSW